MSDVLRSQRCLDESAPAPSRLTSSSRPSPSKTDSAAPARSPVHLLLHLRFPFPKWSLCLSPTRSIRGLNVVRGKVGGGDLSVYEHLLHLPRTNNSEPSWESQSPSVCDNYNKSLNFLRLLLLSIVFVGPILSDHLQHIKMQFVVQFLYILLVFIAVFACLFCI